MHELVHALVAALRVDLYYLPGLSQALGFGFVQECGLVGEVRAAGGDVQGETAGFVDDVEVSGVFYLEFLADLAHIGGNHEIYYIFNFTYVTVMKN